MKTRSIDYLRIIYILYMVGAFVGLTMFVGGILAYIEKGRITDVALERHINKQIRMFWIWLIVVGLLFFISIFAVVSIFAMGTSVDLDFLFPTIPDLSSDIVSLGSVVGIGVYWAFYFVVAFVLFLYILISSITSLRKLDHED